MGGLSKIGRWVDALYIGRSTIFKIFLLGGVAVISAVFIWYTFDVIGQLQTDTRAQVDKYVRIWQLAANSPTSGTELQFIFDEIIVKATLPIIVLDADREPIHWRNIGNVAAGDTTTETLSRLRRVAADMMEQNGEFPLYFGERKLNYFCYGDSDAINRLRMMPFVEIGIVLAFLIVGIIGFQNMRRSEERKIWVGMAKETAHQLGTPITSLMGWLEVTRTECQPEVEAGHRPLFDQTMGNMSTDVKRLEKIANRFGQIGSIPEIEPHDLNSLVQETVEYYRRRLPFGGEGIKLTFSPAELPPVELNYGLLGWALENLLKNALQAVDSREGRISIRTELLAGADNVRIEISDNGAGIPSAAARKIFRAGFTTKKRGWGLGLSLVKRIVEEYHGGWVSLAGSKPGETVFEILLPHKAQRQGSR
ncbi:MAG: HAMP domain-containing histidine kinase [candidate division Zixibacteria bacterium]|nr:HAMP domain-containing histidine kinase [candidate division Zixibacteria bacterium]